MRARGLRVRTATGRPDPGRAFPAATNRRRALSLDQPVTATTSSSIRPRSFFPARAYALAYFAVISARDCIDNPLLIPHNAHRFAGKNM